ncbi:uncharacterized protein [Dipodomys merriami]|uniref:uncharacterized protein n=1 Tax=Dipodomys merriami TaxID=94247 RepID=UPI003855B8C1
MIAEQNGGGDAVHVQPAGPAQPLCAPGRAARSDSDCANRAVPNAPNPVAPARFKLHLLLTVSLIMLALVIIDVILYHPPMISLGLSAPPEPSASSASVPASSKVVFYFLWRSPFFPGPKSRPCVLVPSASTSLPAIRALCVPTALETKGTYLNNDMDSLNPLYACQHEHICRGSQSIINPSLLGGEGGLSPITKGIHSEREQRLHSGGPTPNPNLNFQVK